MSWSIPGCVYGSGSDYADFVWCFKRAATPRLRAMLARPHATITSIPVDWENEFPEWDFNYYCAEHDAIEMPSHPWMAVTCSHCWHTFASSEAVMGAYLESQPSWTLPWTLTVRRCPECGEEW